MGHMKDVTAANKASGRKSRSLHETSKVSTGRGFKKPNSKPQRIGEVSSARDSFPLWPHLRTERRITEVSSVKNADGTLRYPETVKTLEKIMAAQKVEYDRVKATQITVPANDLTTGDTDESFEIVS